jgi:mannose-6-phosphate isomerase-like protein (cupin superfamily)
MKGFVGNIEELSQANANFRQVLYTGKHSQLVLMSLLPGEEIGEEVHEGTDQFLRVDAGSGKAVIDGVETEIHDGYAILVPDGAKHNIVNTGSTEMKLYTLYAPAHHKDGTVHATKAVALESKEEFDGTLSE